MPNDQKPPIVHQHYAGSEATKLRSFPETEKTQIELVIQKILQMIEVEDSCVHSAKYGNRSFAAGLNQSPRTSTSPFVNPQFAKPQHASF
jgi:hypothetical protein